MALPGVGNQNVLDSKSESPKLFDGTTRLYYNSTSPYAQRVLIAVKYKGLKEIECVEISLKDKPTWYKEKVYPIGKVPSLEHNGKVTGESLELLKYLDEHFGGPKIAPADVGKREAATELLKYTDTFNSAGFTALIMKDATLAKIRGRRYVDPSLDHIDKALGKYANEGPFFLGTFGLVDIAYAPFVEPMKIVSSEMWDYDMEACRPNLAKWIEAMDEVQAYSSTKLERSATLKLMKDVLVNY